MFFDPIYLLFIAPALLLALWAQLRVKSAYAAAQQQPASLSGAAAARHILDQAGLQDVNIEMVPGELSDHYDPRQSSSPQHRCVSKPHAGRGGNCSSRIGPRTARRQSVWTAGDS